MKEFTKCLVPLVPTVVFGGGVRRGETLRQVFAEMRGNRAEDRQWEERERIAKESPPFWLEFFFVGSAARDAHPPLKRQCPLLLLVAACILSCQ